MKMMSEEKHLNVNLEVNMNMNINLKYDTSVDKTMVNAHNRQHKGQKVGISSKLPEINNSSKHMISALNMRY